MARKTLIQARRDTAANWTSANPTLAAGELGYETDTGKVKIGNGSTAWNTLAYLGGGSVSPLTTKGDLWGYSSADARIPVGSDGQVLVADSSVGLGVKWASGGAAGTGLTVIFDSTLSSAAASIDTGASSIPAGHQALVLEVVGRSSGAVTRDGIALNVNNDTGANYDWVIFRTVGTAVTAGVNNAQTAAQLGTFPGTSITANYPVVARCIIPAYDQTTFYKTGDCTQGFVYDSNAQNSQGTVVWSWRNTAAITRLKLSTALGNNLVAGTRFTVYALQ